MKKYTFIGVAILATVLQAGAASAISIEIPKCYYDEECSDYIQLGEGGVSEAGSASVGEASSSGGSGGTAPGGSSAPGGGGGGE